jgi:hypothetical protein
MAVFAGVEDFPRDGFFLFPIQFQVSHFSFLRLLQAIGFQR